MKAPSRRLRVLGLLLFLLLGALAGAQVFPDGGAYNEGNPVSGSLASLYAVDSNAYVLSTTTEAGSGNGVASFAASFAIPAGQPPAILHAVVGTNLAGCVLQAYVSNASGNDYLGFRAAPSGTGTVEFALTGDQLARYRDASSGETLLKIRVFRPASSGTGVVTWSTDQLAVLLPILPYGGSDIEGAYASGSLASLFALDGDAYVKTTTLEAGSNNQIAGFSCTFKIPDGTPSAILHAAAKTDLAGSILQGYVDPATGDHYLGYAPMTASPTLVDFPLTSTDVVRRDPSTGALSVKMRMFRPPSAGSGTVTWSVDQLVMYAAPAPGPALPTSLAATAVSASEIDLSWTDNANNETGYLVERKTGANGAYAQVATVPADLTTYHDTDGTNGLVPSTTYVYRVRAKNADGNSPYSNEASAKTSLDPNQGFALQAIAAATSSTKITIYWQKVSGAMGYNLYRSTSETSGFVKINQSPVSGSDMGMGVTNGCMYSDLNLTTGTNYFYKVVPVLDPSGTEGVASDIVFDAPNMKAIPWDTGDAQLIVSRVNYVRSQDTIGWDSQGWTVAIGPNGVQYASSLTGGLPETSTASATFNSITNTQETTGLGSYPWIYEAVPITGNPPTSEYDYKNAGDTGIS